MCKLIGFCIWQGSQRDPNDWICYVFLICGCFDDHQTLFIKPLLLISTIRAGPKVNTKPISDVHMLVWDCVSPMYSPCRSGVYYFPGLGHWAVPENNSAVFSLRLVLLMLHFLIHINSAARPIEGEHVCKQCEKEGVARTYTRTQRWAYGTAAGVKNRHSCGWHRVHAKAQCKLPHVKPAGPQYNVHGLLFFGLGPTPNHPIYII